MHTDTEASSVKPGLKLNSNHDTKAASPNSQNRASSPKNNNERDQMALVLKNEGVINQVAMNNIQLRQKISFKHQFFILSLLEYICNMLNLKDKQAAESHFQGKQKCLGYLREREVFVKFVY